LNSTDFELWQSYQSDDSKEDFYAVTFGKRRKNFVQEQQILCAGGKGAEILVIDIHNREKVISLLGCTYEVYDLKVCPESPSHNYNLLCSASRDEVRVWNLDSFACICIFGGPPDGHRLSKRPKKRRLKKEREGKKKPSCDTQTSPRMTRRQRANAAPYIDQSEDEDKEEWEEKKKPRCGTGKQRAVVGKSEEEKKAIDENATASVDQSEDEDKEEWEWVTDDENAPDDEESRTKSVFSVAWHPHGKQIASGGDDGRVVIWNVLFDKRAREKMTPHQNLRARPLNDAVDASQPTDESMWLRTQFNPKMRGFADSVHDDIHTEKIDCVMWLGKEDDALLLSKALDGYIVLWKPLPRSKPGEDVKPTGTIFPIKQFHYAMNQRIYFLRFDVTTKTNFLATGNPSGDIYVWDLEDYSREWNYRSLRKKSEAANKNSYVKKKNHWQIIRSEDPGKNKVAFSPDGNTLVGCDVGGNIFRWSRDVADIEDELSDIEDSMSLSEEEDNMKQSKESSLRSIATRSSVAFFEDETQEKGVRGREYSSPKAVADETTCSDAPSDKHETPEKGEGNEYQEQKAGSPDDALDEVAYAQYLERVQMKSLPLQREERRRRREQLRQYNWVIQETRTSTGKEDFSVVEGDGETRSKPMRRSSQDDCEVEVIDVQDDESGGGHLVSNIELQQQQGQHDKEVNRLDNDTRSGISCLQGTSDNLASVHEYGNIHAAESKAKEAESNGFEDNKESSNIIAQRTVNSADDNEDYEEGKSGEENQGFGHNSESDEEHSFDFNVPIPPKEGDGKEGNDDPFSELRF
jgi:WD40 repeat protein